jgi:hypothetical protein
VDATNFEAFCERLNEKIEYQRTGPPDLPFEDPFDVERLQDVIREAAASLPLEYQNEYCVPLVNHLQGLVGRLRADGVDPQEAARILEPFMGAVYDWTVSEIRPQLQRFLAVISNLYRSFLSAQHRAGADIPLIEQLPPLATFAHEADQGPFTITADDIRRYIGGRSGVVSLPSSYRDHPVLWASLAHETGGHDVLHADRKLLPQLRRGVAHLFPDNKGLGQLFAYWMDETASDVYGLLNMGPSFVFNLAAFFTTLVHQLTGGEWRIGILSNLSYLDEKNQLDPHPTDLLRVHVALGAVESLHGLSVSQRGSYAHAIEQLASTCAGGAETINIWSLTEQRVVRRFPLAAMQAAARTVGAFIADATLGALAGHSIQDIETWDDDDEATVQTIVTQFSKEGSVAGLGDDAQLLGGATIALLEQSSSYDDFTTQLNEALDESFARDPIFGLPRPHRILFKPELFRRNSVNKPVSPPAIQLIANGTEW